MRRVVDELWPVQYGQSYVVSEPGDQPDLSEAFAGQASGLCGAAVPGFLWLNTGLHTGDVGFTVEVHDQAPALDPIWEDVVEVSFQPSSDNSMLAPWGDPGGLDLGLVESEYRVRYSAVGMDKASEADTHTGETPLDRYLLQFWPAPFEPDLVVRQTSDTAAYWHRYARDLPVPAEHAERAAVERRARKHRARSRADRQARRDQIERDVQRRGWGGRSPDDSPPAPVVAEAVGDVLEVASVPDGVTVLIPPYPGMAAGQIVEVIWRAGTAFHLIERVSRPATVTKFAIGDKHLRAAAVRGAVTVSYHLISADYDPFDESGTISSESETLSLRVT